MQVVAVNSVFAVNKNIAFGSAISNFEKYDGFLKNRSEFAPCVENIKNADKKLDELLLNIAKFEKYKFALSRLQENLKACAANIKDHFDCLAMLDKGREYDKTEKETIKPFSRHNYQSGHTAENEFEQSHKDEIENLSYEISKISRTINVISDEIKSNR